MRAHATMYIVKQNINRTRCHVPHINTIYPLRNEEKLNIEVSTVRIQILKCVKKKRKYYEVIIGLACSYICMLEFKYCISL